jgi:hypothetical protein
MVKKFLQKFHNGIKKRRKLQTFEVKKLEVVNCLQLQKWKTP